MFWRPTSTCPKKYAEFVYAGIGAASPWDNLQGQLILGKENFLHFIEQLVGEKANIREIPRVQRFLLKQPNLEQLTLAKNLKNIHQRNRAMYELHYNNGLTINEIAKLFSLHPGYIGKIIRCQS